MEQKSLFDGIRDGKPIPNEPIAITAVIPPFNKVTEFNLPIVEKPWTNNERMLKKLSDSI